MSFKAEFNLSDITSQLGNASKEIEKNFFRAFSYIGEQYINDARRINTYTDRTGVLRASIGYSILKDGKALSFVTKESNQEADEASRSLVNEVKRNNKKGYALIVFAGAEYAAWVESKGYDVITGSAPTSSEVQRDLKQLLGGINL